MTNSILILIIKRKTARLLKFLLIYQNQILLKSILLFQQCSRYLYVSLSELFSSQYRQYFCSFTKSIRCKLKITLSLVRNFSFYVLKSVNIKASSECEQGVLQQGVVKPIETAERRKEIPFKVKTTKLPKARENAGNQVTIGFIYASDWSRWRREFSRPIIH